MALWYHLSTLALSSIPLALNWEQRSIPLPFDLGMALGVAGTSFVGQLLLSRGFQLLDASKAAAINFTQVGRGRGVGGGRWQAAARTVAVDLVAALMTAIHRQLSLWAPAVSAGVVQLHFWHDIVW